MPSSAKSENSFHLSSQPRFAGGKIGNHCADAIPRAPLRRVCPRRTIDSEAVSRPAPHPIRSDVPSRPTLSSSIRYSCLMRIEGLEVISPRSSRRFKYFTFGYAYAAILFQISAGIHKHAFGDKADYFGPNHSQPSSPSLGAYFMKAMCRGVASMSVIFMLI